MRSFLELLYHSAERPRFLLFLLVGAVAAVVGFFVVPVGTATALIQQGGYYYILAVFAGFCGYAICVYRQSGANWPARLRRPGAALLLIGAGTLFLYWADPFRHKILFDEYVLQGTAYYMHASKEVGTIVRAYDINGSWVVINVFLDKRPYFFAFLVSLLHDFTGYRIENIFVVNALLAPIFLSLSYWLARELAGRKAALFVLALLFTMPLLGQNVSCAGMELHNLTMIAAVMVIAVLYLRAPDAPRLSLLVLGTVLLAQSRYESVIFVAPVAVIILVGWLREGRLILSWPAVLAPLLLVPYAWHNRILSANPILWQLAPGQTSRFSTGYLAGNLEGAWRFFFNRTPALANSLLLSIAGLAGFVLVAWRAAVWLRASPRRPLDAPTLVTVLFGAGIAANLGLLMFYYWSRLDDVIASRFALPMYLLLALVAGVLVRWLAARFVYALRVAVVILGVWFCGWDIEAFSQREYTTKNMVMQEIDWEHEYLLSRPPGRILFITNLSTMPFLLWHVPAILTETVPERSAQLRFHLKAGTFSEILVAQELRPSTANGDLGVDPKDLLPNNFHLQALRIGRFGTRCVRISRLVSVDEPAPSGSRPSAGTVAVTP